MDRLVDHLFVFEGEGKVKDFPGNYSQFRIWQREQELTDSTPVKKEAPVSVAATAALKRKWSYKEKREFEKLQQEIEDLTKEKSRFRNNWQKAMCSHRISITGSEN